MPDPTPPPQTAVLSRLLSRLVPQSNGCLIWPMRPNKYGYGQIPHEGKTKRAHRLFYELQRGPIPEGLVLDHLCRNRMCCNVDHLEAVTLRENVLRGVGHTAINATKTHCKNGHPFGGNNLLIRPDGSRKCRECHRLHVRRYDHKRRGVSSVFPGERIKMPSQDEEIRALRDENKRLRDWVEKAEHGSGCQSRVYKWYNEPIYQTPVCRGNCGTCARCQWRWNNRHEQKPGDCTCGKDAALKGTVNV